jgi:hypothetical protein
MEFLLPLLQLQFALLEIADVDHHALPQQATVRLGDGHRIDPNPAHIPFHQQTALPVKGLGGRHPSSSELLKALSVVGVDGLEGEVGIGLQGLQLNVHHLQPAAAGEQEAELTVGLGQQHVDANRDVFAEPLPGKEPLR